MMSVVPQFITQVPGGCLFVNSKKEQRLKVALLASWDFLYLPMPIHSAMGGPAKYLLSEMLLLKESGIIVDRSVWHSNLFSINVAESPAVQF